jgi:DNA-binding transcriptional regulator LsrR (DeoR family)
MSQPQISRQYRWKVQARLAVLEYVTGHGLKAAAERFGLDRKTVREWRNRAKADGVVGLVPRYPARRRGDEALERSVRPVPAEPGGERSGLGQRLHGLVHIPTAVRQCPQEVPVVLRQQ